MAGRRTGGARHRLAVSQARQGERPRLLHRHAAVRVLARSARTPDRLAGRHHLLTRIPTSEATGSAAACADRMQKLLDSEPLTLAVRGGGIPDGERSLVPNGVVVIERRELEEVV